MAYMFNELSLSKVESREVVCKLLEHFVGAVIEAKRMGLQDLRLHEAALPNLYEMNLHDEYSIGAWLNDGRIDPDIRGRFREIVTSTPLVKAEEPEESELYSRSEFFKVLDEKKHQVWGLGVAHLFDMVTLSLCSHAEWEKKEIEIDHQWLDKDANLQREVVFVRNFSSVGGLKVYREWWDERQKDALKKSTELWEKRKEFFPNIELCGEVERQLGAIGVSKELSQIVDRLKTLDRYAASWKEGDFNYKDVNATSNLQISPESVSTMLKFGAQRKFNIPGQGKKSCELHIKAGDLRFHFYPDNATKKIYVGYIGKHLRIASRG